MSPTKPKPCPDCGGRGSVAFATEIVECAACGGSGKQSSAPTPSTSSTADVSEAKK